MGVKGFVEGGIASIVAGCSTHPLDLIKVRMQLQGESSAAAAQPALRPALAFQAGAHTVTLPHAPTPVAPGAPPPYAGALDCALKTVRSEGVMALYKGFIPTVSRQGPFTVVLFVTLEQVRKVFKDVEF
uniref:Uncharacterized protein n=1 Tax=Aegilops tauschii TaxID=37682 RepID=N1QRS7_AEGTA